MKYTIVNNINTEFNITKQYNICRTKMNLKNLKYTHV
jgi:hypothetical protein